MSRAEAKISYSSLSAKAKLEKVEKMSKCDIKKRVEIENMKQKVRYKHTKRTSRQTYAKKMSIKQRVWNYMRRNRMFRVKDIVAIMELKESTIRYIICNLEAAGYVIRKTPNTNKKVFFMNATFVFTAKEHILIAPIITSKEVYCTTTNIKTYIGARKILRKVLKLGASQGEVAKVLNVDKSTISLLCNNKYPNPSLLYEKIRSAYRQNLNLGIAC